MQSLALSAFVVTALAAIGGALWTWRALAGIGLDGHDLAGFDDLSFHDRRLRS